MHATRCAAAFAALLTMLAALGCSNGHAEIAPLMPLEPDVAPPPISGGTLLVSADGARAIAADSDRDRVYVIGLDALALERTIGLGAADEPGRVVEDGAGHVHVVLRGAGAVATIDPSAGVVIARQDVCAAPRGIAWDAATDVVHVACAGGELVSLPAAGGAPVRSLQLDDDLRDVVVGAPDGGLWVTRFRSAEVIVLDASGVETARLVPPPTPFTGTSTWAPEVAWRAIGTPSGLAMVHQRAQVDAVQVDSTGYGNGPCFSGSVISSVTLFSASGIVSADLRFSVLPVDIARSTDGATFTVANAGWSDGRRSFPLSVVEPAELAILPRCNENFTESTLMSAPVAVAYDSAGRLLTLARQPAALYVGETRIPLDPSWRGSNAHDLFHRMAGFPIACASCHPEGGDDGHVWEFSGVGRRRTQSLRGGILGTEPFHWNGDERDMTQIMVDGFVGRMGGSMPQPSAIAALAEWIDAIPALPRSPVSADAVARGSAVFAAAGCASCHAGAAGTNNETVDVGTGAAFQVPWLIGVSARAPYLHDGCAATLPDIFTEPCATGEHELALPDAERDDLVAYLRSR